MFICEFWIFSSIFYNLWRLIDDVLKCHLKKKARNRKFDEEMTKLIFSSRQTVHFVGIIWFSGSGR